jgi:AcrR family transcriptional regulator
VSAAPKSSSAMDGRRARSRRRGAELEEAILRAARDELADGGYARLTMDRVARRAGTNKTVIYRRWPNRAALALAAYHQFAGEPEGPPDTGALRSDVLALLRGTAERINSPLGAAILHGVLSEVHQQPDLTHDVRPELFGQEPGAMLAILVRAVARGEARPVALTPRIATLPAVLLRHEFQTHGVDGIPDEAIVEIVDQIYLPLVLTQDALAGER